GTMISAVSRVEADGSIVSDLKFERSLVTPRRQPEGGDPAAITPQGTASVNVRTTVRARPGEPVLVGGRQHGSGKDAAQTWLVLTASVAPRAAGEKPKAAAAAGPEEELKIVQLKNASAPALATVLASVFQREFRIAVDERTNSLLLRGSPERLVIAVALIARLDES
ncbi:MAG TPA: secretin N-terminal domain-containing protein, partial [Pirellulaceae bacterium]|nr:secretin N-terminal domain-containing protein [Pirellulaceae bacterium]